MCESNCGIVSDIYFVVQVIWVPSHSYQNLKYDLLLTKQDQQVHFKKKYTKKTLQNDEFYK